MSFTHIIHCMLQYTAAAPAALTAGGMAMCNSIFGLWSFETSQNYSAPASEQAFYK